MAASTGQHSQIYIWLLYWDVLSSPRLHVLYRTECSSDLGMLYKLICWVLLVCLTWCSRTLRGWVWAKITSFLINLHHCGTLSGNTSLTVPSLIRKAVCCTPSIEAVQWSMLGAQPAVLRLKLNSTMKFLTQASCRPGMLPKHPRLELHKGPLSDTSILGAYQASLCFL